MLYDEPWVWQNLSSQLFYRRPFLDCGQWGKFLSGLTDFFLLQYLELPLGQISIAYKPTQVVTEKTTPFEKSHGLHYFHDCIPRNTCTLEKMQHDVSTTLKVQRPVLHLKDLREFCAT